MRVASLALLVIMGCAPATPYYVSTIGEPDVMWVNPNVPRSRQMHQAIECNDLRQRSVLGEIIFYDCMKSYGWQRHPAS